METVITDSLKDKFDRELAARNREIDNFILKQRRIEQARARKLDTIEHSYKLKAD